MRSFALPDPQNREELIGSGWRVAVACECALCKDAATTMAADIETWLVTNLPTYETP